MWGPVGETGGKSHHNGITRPGWHAKNHCARVDKGHWSRDKKKGHAYNYGAAVKFAKVVGIDLSIKRGYSSAQRLDYHLKKRRWLCGNNDFPSTAGKTIDRVHR